MSAATRLDGPGVPVAVEPLVLLPGMNCSTRLWHDVTDRLAPSGVRVVHAPLEEDDLDDCVDRLLTRLPDRFALAGLSLGGIVAMALCRRAPERVSRLALLSTNPLPPTQTQREGWRRHLAALESGATARELQAEMLPVLLRPGAPPRTVETVLAMADEVGADLLARQLRLQGTRVDERPALRRVAVPTLVLAAEDDLLCPVDRHEAIRDAVDGARLVVLRRTAHLSTLERPAAVADELLTWLAR